MLPMGRARSRTATHLEIIFGQVVVQVVDADLGAWWRTEAMLSAKRLAWDPREHTRLVRPDGDLRR